MGFFDRLFGTSDYNDSFNENEIVRAIRANDLSRLTRIAVNNYSLLQYEDQMNRVESDGHTFLSRLLKNGQSELAKYVMNFGARLDIRLPNGKTVVEMNADRSISGYLNAIDCLMNGNFEANDVIAFDTRKIPLTPVMWMTKLGYYYGLRHFLANRGADPNRCYGNYTTPLMVATEMSYVHFIDLLAKYGARMNQSDGDGWSALSFAAANIDHVPNGLGLSAQALIRNGADVNHRNNRGQTPLALAIHYGNNVVASVLRGAGAVI